MTIKTLESDLKELTDILLEMAKSHSWNKISNGCRYIITEIVDSKENFFAQRKIRKRINKGKIPRNLGQIIPDITAIFENIYDLNLVVYSAEATRTIIEIQYYPKSSLDREFFETIKDNEPMAHCKVAIPPYLSDRNAKFDINWELGGLRHQWKMFLWRREIRREKEKRQLEA